MTYEFIKATTEAEKEAIDLFLTRHNSRGKGSTRGYVAYYAARAAGSPDGRPSVNRIVAAAKFCPLHTPQAARFFAGDEWRHVYCLQRLAAHQSPKNLLSEFVGWCLRDMGQDPKVWYIVTYADTGHTDPRTGLPHDGGIYRATNAVYCGLTQGNRIEGYRLDGQRYSLRKGPKTLRISDIPARAKIIRNRPKHRYCWAVGSPLKRAFRRRKLVQRMSRFTFSPVYQPRLLSKLQEMLKVMVGWSPWRTNWPQEVL